MVDYMSSGEMGGHQRRLLMRIKMKGQGEALVGGEGGWYLRQEQSEQTSSEESLTRQLVGEEGGSLIGLELERAEVRPAEP